MARRQDSAAGSNARVLEADSLGIIVAEAQSLLTERPVMADAPKRHMTRWLDPIGRRRNDRMQAHARKHDDRDTHAPDAPPKLNRYDADETGAFGFDYVADVGDAFDPTMQVAWTLGRRMLTFEPREGTGSRVPLPRGSLLVFGGDEVYPCASPAHYRVQLELPFGLAAERGANADVLAIPGNHDWWGGLDHWRGVFCRNAPLGSWSTKQSTSWWAIGLPHGWWMWGLDTFLDGTINDAQRAYFGSAARELAPGDRVILCTPVPLWHLRTNETESLIEIDRFVAELVTANGATTPLYLAGDSHLFAAYRRLRADGTNELHVTAGGGGAFLQPTHHLATSVPESEIDANSGSGVDPARFTDGQFWPHSAESHAHVVGTFWRTLLDWQSLTLAGELGALHALYGAAAGLGARRLHGAADHRSIGQVLRALLTSWPGSTASVAGLLLFLKFGTGFARPDMGERAMKRIARRVGVVHGLVQFAVLVAVAALVHLLLWPRHANWPPFAGLRAAALGGVIGGLTSVAVLIRYLLSVNRRFPVNGNEAFAAQHLTDNKHFLRCRIMPDGSLTLWLIAKARPDSGWERAYRSGAVLPPSAAASEAGAPIVIAEVPWSETI